MEVCVRWRRVKDTISRDCSNVCLTSEADPLQGASIPSPFEIYDAGDDSTEGVGDPVVQLDVATGGEGLAIFIKCTVE